MRTLVSARLGADFTELWTASAVSTIGDGVTMASGPVLIASITTNPALAGRSAEDFGGRHRAPRRPRRRDHHPYDPGAHHGTARRRRDDAHPTAAWRPLRQASTV